VGARLEVLLLTGFVQAKPLLSSLPDGSFMLALGSLGQPLLLNGLALALHRPTHPTPAHLPLLLIPFRRLQRTPPILLRRRR
jgi:hypothetical protein